MTTKKIKKTLEKAIGKNKVFTEKEYLITYSYDATGIRHCPDMVVFPESEDDISKILKISYMNKIPVTPRGAGVGYSGGAIPVKNGIVMVFTKMNKILKIDTHNFLAVVEPGVITFELQKECEKKQLFYPPDPASLKTSTIGGNVAENAGGPRCFKYGVTANYILSIEGFLVNGDRIKTSVPVIKDVAGYDIKSLLIGSEGTLAVISKVMLRLLPLPDVRILFRVDFKSLKSGAKFINQIIKSNVFPSVLEFMDKRSILEALRFLGISMDKSIEASVLIEIDGNKVDVLERKRRFIEIVKNAQAVNFVQGETFEEQEQLWEIRRNISPAISRLKAKKINEDIVVPVSHIPDAVEFINSLANKFDLDIVLFGHFGDGNIHTNIMVDPENEEEMKKAKKVINKIFQYVISINGSITGEHGIGITKKDFLPWQLGKSELEIMKKVKKIFDPENLLNPGKILP